MDWMNDVVKEVSSKIAQGASALSTESFNSMQSMSRLIGAPSANAVAAIERSFGELKLVDSADLEDLPAAKMVVDLKQTAVAAAEKIAKASKVTELSQPQPTQKMFDMTGMMQTFDKLNAQPQPSQKMFDITGMMQTFDKLNQQPTQQSAGIGRMYGDLTSLNPQPLPPRWNYMDQPSALFQQLGGMNRMFDGLSALNPQPLPPRWNFMDQQLPLLQQLGGINRMFDGSTALNPQPLPPRWNYMDQPSALFQQLGGMNRMFDGLSALNPQPLPPRWNQLNPQPLPPRWNYLNPQPLPPRWNVLNSQELSTQRLGNIRDLQRQSEAATDRGFGNLLDMFNPGPIAPLDYGDAFKKQNAEKQQAGSQLGNVLKTPVQDKIAEKASDSLKHIAENELQKVSKREATKLESFNIQTQLSDLQNAENLAANVSKKLGSVITNNLGKI